MFHVEHLDGFGGVIGQKAPSLPDRPGWFLGRAGGKEKTFGLQKAKGNTEERKSSTWNIEGYFAGNWTKGPLPARQAGLVSWAEPEEKKKAFGPQKAKGITDEKRHDR